MTTKLLVPAINKFLEKQLAPYAQYLNPNVITVVSLIFPLITFYLFSTEQFFWGTVSMVFFLADKLDGAVARAGKKSSQWGGFLDATIDRVTDSIIFVAIGIGLASQDTWILGTFAMLSGLLVSYSKAKAEASLGIKAIGTNELSIGIMERTERIVLVGISTFLYSFFSADMIGTFNIIDIGLSISIVLTVITFIMRLNKAYQLLEQTK